ncbi:MAG: prepilin-type N-terminal cleavage/methylation domain-containing protein [Bacilli bacterium]|nr:prepilin-type N-terminal cleavage/methylation domain-containing protein [Bacilli bacterium]
MKKVILKKMNNKGFNLVEMIAVVALIALLTGIGAAAYSKYYLNAQDRVFQNYEDGMKEAAIDYILDTGDMPTSSRSLTLPLSDLLTNGYIDPFKNPRVDGDKCNGTGSYVQVKVKPKTATSDGKIDNNVTYDYKVCLVCGDYYKTSGC